MAVTFLRLKSNIRQLYPLWKVLQTFRLNSENKDSMEAFISELTQKKVNKFNQLRRESFIRRNQSRAQISVEQHELIEDIYSCLDDVNEELLEKSVDKWLENPAHRFPRSALCEVLEFSSCTGNAALFQKLASFTKTYDPEFHDENISYLDALSLELDWRTGQNIDLLIDKFELMYKRSIYDNEMTKLMTRLSSTLIQDCVARKGESVVIKLKDRIERMCEESKDYQLLFDLWRNLFESFWFSDQQIASDLIMKNAPLRKHLSKQLSLLCFIYLRNNNTELVNRLIQIFLQSNMTRQVEILVKILFDFECWRRNLDAVLQIVQLCLKLDIQLTDKENKKFLDLLLKRPRDAKPRPETKKITIEKYQFKF